MEERKVKEIMTVKEFAMNSGLTESGVRKSRIASRNWK